MYKNMPCIGGHGYGSSSGVSVNEEAMPSYLSIPALLPSCKCVCSLYLYLVYWFVVKEPLKTPPF